MRRSKKMTMVSGWEDFQSKVLPDASENQKLAMRVAFFGGAQVAMMRVREMPDVDPMGYIERLEDEIFAEAAAMVASGAPKH